VSNFTQSSSNPLINHVPARRVRNAAGSTAGRENRRESRRFETADARLNCLQLRCQSLLNREHVTQDGFSGSRGFCLSFLFLRERFSQVLEFGFDVGVLPVK
jgi:hypothetical protein